MWTVIGLIIAFLVLGFVLTHAPQLAGFRAAVKDTQSFAATSRFTYQLLAAVTWIWQYILRPVSKPIRAVIGMLYRAYRRLWDKVVYRETGEFSRTRAGILLASTMAFLYVLPTILLFFGQAALFVTSWRRETVYLSRAQEIYPDDDIHAVVGSESPDITDQTTITFRVGPTMFNHVWSIFYNGDIFYPDEVAAVATGDINKCSILSYGFRWKFMMRRWDIYPDILSARCDPIAEKK